MPDDMRTTQKVRLQYMATEPNAARQSTGSLLEGWFYETDEPLLDGPVSRRVAVIDIDPTDGTIANGATFRPPTAQRTVARYAVADETDLTALDFQQVSVFGAIMKMIDMFEEDDVLGRRLQWAFKGQQLLVVPRAGVMENAFYHRDSRALQFFFFPDPKDPASTIFTCLSPDIVAHETAHAILDGIAPDLYDATSPQSLAIHEAIADIGAVMFALRSKYLRLEVLERTQGDLSQSNAFNEIARQFGEAKNGHPLRDLTNTKTMENAPTNPHGLSEVLSGALYAIMVQIQKEEIDQLVVEKPGSTRLSVSGRALDSAAQRLKRLAFRGLDYLPPGEASFADYGRAIVAADTSTNPNEKHLRDVTKQQFVDRKIIGDAGELDPSLPVDFVLPPDLDLDLLMTSDWAAYQFAEKFRKELRIPASISFEVRPRLDVTKRSFRRGKGRARVREFILKVAWRETKAMQARDGLYDDVSVTFGTTLAINWESKQICGLVSTSPADPSQKSASARLNDAMRIEFLEQCLTDGRLEVGAPNVQVQDRTLRVRAMGQMLHMVEP